VSQVNQRTLGIFIEENRLRRRLLVGRRTFLVADRSLLQAVIGRHENQALEDTPDQRESPNPSPKVRSMSGQGSAGETPAPTVFEKTIEFNSFCTKIYITGYSALSTIRPTTGQFNVSNH
jgi:hypothetical protein